MMMPNESLVPAALPRPLARSWREHRVLFGRWLSQLRRERLSAVALLAQPMVWLLLFGHLFTAMAQTAQVPGGSYLRFMTAGAVVMTTFNGCLVGGVELLFDRESGFLVRMLAAPASRLSIVTSRFIYLAAVTTVQGLIIMAAAAVMGVRYATGLAGVAACLAVGALFGAGVTALSVGLAFSLKSHGQFFPIIGLVSLPLTFASSALVPLTLMPGWMQVLARLNPMTYAIDALRALVLTGWQAGPLLRITAILLAFDALCLAAATLALRRGAGGLGLPPAWRRHRPLNELATGLRRPVLDRARSGVYKPDGGKSSSSERESAPSAGQRGSERSREKSMRS